MSKKIIESFTREDLILIFIITLAFLLRFFGVSFGLPYLYHTDEPIVVNHALAYASGDLNPHFFKIPPLISYLLFIVYGVYYVIGKFCGVFGGVEDFSRLFLTNPTTFYLIARIFFGVIAGTLSVYALYRLVQKYFSVEHALVSAFFFAVTFLHVRDSHYVYVDIPVVLALIVCFYFIFEILSTGKRKAYFWFGVTYGIATGVKYNAVFVIIPFFLAHVLSCRSRKVQLIDFNLIMSLVLSGVVFFAANPFALIDFSTFSAEILHQAGAEGMQTWFHHLAYSLAGGLGIPLLAIALYGLLRGCFYREPKRWILCSFIICYYLVLCFKSQSFARYALPIVPFVCFFAADGLITISSQGGWKKALPLTCVLVMMPSLYKVILSDDLFLRGDVRTEAKQWVNNEIPAHAKIALDENFFMPQLKMDLRQLLEKRQEILGGERHYSSIQKKRLDILIDQAQKEGDHSYELYFLKQNSFGQNFLFSTPSVPLDLSYLKKIGIQFLILTKTEKENANFYKLVRESGSLVKRFTPYKDISMEWPIDRLALTGGPFLLEDLISRNKNGEVVEIYRLS